MGFIVKLLLLPLKFFRWIIGFIVIAIIVALLISTPAETISEYQRGAIAENCSSIKQSLQITQKNDSRTRTYLGTTYEMLLNRLIIPLNVRLIKNSMPDAHLSRIQSDWTSEQQKFRTSYIDYMNEMDHLLSIDCRVQPDDFYVQLEKVRTRRETLRETTVRLSELAEEQYDAVTTLQESL